VSVNALCKATVLRSIDGAFTGAAVVCASAEVKIGVEDDKEDEDDKMVVVLDVEPDVDVIDVVAAACSEVDVLDVVDTAAGVTGVTTCDISGALG
jgi:hypothetical protein